MKERIPFGRPFIDAEEEHAVVRVLRSGWLTTGTETLCFEQEFAAFLDAGNDGIQQPLRALAVNSATSGLHLALEAAGVGPGDVVLVPSYTFAATAEVARHLGAELAFVDVSPGSFLMDIAQLEVTIDRLSAGKTAYVNGGPCGVPRAVIPVHFAGLSCDMDAIMDKAARSNLTVVEDAAHALPAPYSGGGFAGTKAHIGVFSFYATKPLTTGEGGMIVSRDENLLRRMTTMRLHGIDRPIWNRYTGDNASWYYEVIEAGYKYNMPDVLAALGRVQLKRIEILWSMRKGIAARYDEAFSADERFIIPPTDSSDARHLYPLRLGPACPISRDECIRRLQEQYCIGTSVHFIPLHTMPFYTKRYGIKEDDLPETMRSFKAEISLPLCPGMTDSHIKYVIEAVCNVCR
ncbi:MAG: DegT/DnrJ/EryC1/StrS family aminotransferase [Spirochaetaceae bacterium]|jgi:dTDP-4-amino-4,6-dideoxygalactose transaminase|nr:DegT/DnrJ/EryC1/StrS family aminotransferase [Spirochaetaceae bacterium]